MISFNQSLFLREAMGSVLTQDFSDWELICVDPGSSDGSREIIEEFSRIDKRIGYYFQPDKGPADGLNIALLKSKGQIFGCLNSDDMYLPGTFSRVSKAFGDNPSASCIYGHGFVLKEDTLSPLTSDYFSPSRYFNGRGLVIQQSTFFLRDKILERNLKFNISNHTCWDGEFLIDCSIENSSFVRVNQFWGIFRNHQHSITGSQNQSSQYELDSERLFIKATQLYNVGKPIRLVVQIYAAYRKCRNFFFMWLFFPSTNIFFRFRSRISYTRNYRNRIVR
jgi:glycosyltransferase involved in cell wall biosynthesis